jgi:peptidoglycan/LPS O-acetylase OafA/YrhL
VINPDQKYSPTHFNFIDALRGYAILGVIIVHTSQNGSKLESDLGNTFAILGARGVQLFFIVSALTLFYSFNTRSIVSKFDLKNYFSRRFFRIAPMFYFAICLYLFQKWHSGNDIFNLENFWNISSAFTFTQSLHPYWVSGLVPGGWSVSVEFLFYLILPILFYSIKNIKHAFNFFVLTIFFRVLISSVLLKYQLIESSDHWYSLLIYYLPNQLPVFSLGILLYFLIFDKNREKINLFTLISFVIMGLVDLTYGHWVFFSEHILTSALFALFIYTLNFQQSSIIVNRVINYIGKISFSIYVLHFSLFYWFEYFNILDLFQNTYLNYIFKFCLVTISSILLASLTYNFIEVPFQVFGKRLTTYVKYKFYK